MDGRPRSRKGWGPLIRSVRGGDCEVCLGDSWDRNCLCKFSSYRAGLPPDRLETTKLIGCALVLEPFLWTPFQIPQSLTLPWGAGKRGSIQICQIVILPSLHVPIYQVLSLCFPLRTHWVLFSDHGQCQPRLFFFTLWYTQLQKRKGNCLFSD